MAGEAEAAAIAFLLQLDPATQLEVLKRYEEVFQTELDTMSSRLRRVVSAMHQARRTVGRSPSVREYKALRREHPERDWPDARSITRWLGVRSWNDALVRLRLEPVLDGDVIETQIGPAYSIAEVITAVRDCAADLGRAPTITDYLAWQRRPDVSDRPGRRPAGTWVFNRIFGGFPQARVAAGIAEGDSSAAHPSYLLLRSSNYRISDEQILDDIRLVAGRRSGHLTATVYDQERRLLYQETKTAGRPRALAGVGTIYRHFASWTAALEAAGVDPSRRVPGPRDRKLPRFSRAQLLRALAEAAAGTPRLSVKSYREWRASELRRDPDRRAVLPSEVTLFRRFGSWTAAVRAAGLTPHEGLGAPIFWTPDRVLEALRAQATEHRRVSSARDDTLRSAAIRRFGSWQAACEAAGVASAGGRAWLMARDRRPLGERDG